MAALLILVFVFSSLSQPQGWGDGPHFHILFTESVKMNTLALAPHARNNL